MKETILYYPTINIPSKKWIRQALFYWDEIGSIVPEDYGYGRRPQGQIEVEFLQSEGEFRPFRPHDLYRDSFSVVGEFLEELRNIILSAEFQKGLKPQEARRLSKRVHREKVSNEAFWFLYEQGLAIQHQDESDWFYFEERTGLVFMALLAKYIAREDSEYTIPGTDLRAYEKLTFSARDDNDAIPGVAVEFARLLPVPTESNSLQDILIFKRKRKDELLRFRKEVRDIQRKVSESSDQSELREAIADFQLKLTTSLNDLHSALKDAKIGTAAGTFQALLTGSSSGLLSSMFTGFPTVGVVAGAGIGIGKFLLDRSLEYRKQIRSSPVAYLYHAKQYSLI